MGALLDNSHFGLLQSILLLILGGFLYFTSVFLPLMGILYVIYFILTLPMRRNERARLFLDLLELGLKDGQTPENTVMSAAASHDRELGIRTHLIAEQLHSGCRLSQALERVPRLLPPQIAAMLKAGERIGEVGKVLPACRHLLRDGVSNVRGALNYVLLITFVLTPVSIILPIIIRIKVLPSFMSVFETMSAEPTPALTRFVFGGTPLFTMVQCLLVFVIWAFTVTYIGGPRLRGWFRFVLPQTVDWFLYRMPWRRKRLQRDFSAMLAVLLDAGVPEAEAVMLAGEATVNLVMLGRAMRVRALLNEGVKLPEAIRAMDESRELGWRLSNALRGSGGFLKALSGWHDALDAKAFQLEQTAAQTTTTALVLCNGLVVGCIVVGLFVALIQVINEAVLW
jgi:type II secretory pathway component PulF